MRQFMLKNRPVYGCVDGVSLTIPGPVWEVKKAVRFFGDFSHEAEKAGFCFVWRLEKQIRGQLHFHLVVGCESSPARIGNKLLGKMWKDKLRSLGRVEFNPPYELKNRRGEVYGSCCWEDNLMCLPGAEEHAVDVKEKGNSGAWMRYMQDHTSKLKQEQIAVDVGRQWGIVGRKRFVKVPADQVELLSDHERDRFLRPLQRMMTARVPCPDAFPLNDIPGFEGCGVHRSKDDAWFYCRGYRPKRGHIGKSVWFEEPSKIEAVKRLVKWAREG